MYQKAGGRVDDNELKTRNVVLERRDEETVASLARREGYGPRGFSIALRKIIREWDACKRVDEGAGDERSRDS
jgi:hypothetical protein